ncbi:MAG: hypothetical protein CMN37_08405 [SAR116 cluster bacterium]|nr:hypothetical protein [SAR116 cluster bacterium]
MIIVLIIQKYIIKMKIDSSNKQNKEKEFAPIINLKFLKIIVIALGLSIFLLIFVIVYKVMNGDLQKNNPNNIQYQNTKYSEFKLELPNVKSIKSIDWDDGNIFIILDDNLSMKLLSIDNKNKLKVIQIINSKDIKYTKFK